MAIVDLKTEITGNVWKVVVKVGDRVAEGDPVMILESMKMEIPISAPEPGMIKEILAEEGTTVTEGMVVARLDS